MAHSSGGEWFDDCLAGLTAYSLTSLPVWAGILFGMDFSLADGTPSAPPPDFVSACIHFDAVHYVDIARQGYTYDPAKRSLVAFFPAYPLLSRWVSEATGRTVEEAALLTAQAALLGAFVLLARYVRTRWPEATAQQRGIVLAVFGLWPMGLFFRMPYTEGLFVCVTLAMLYGMARGWPLIVLGLLAGLGTSVRPVGVALTAALLWHVLIQPCRTFWTKVGRVLFLGPLACWGLLAYVGYQGLTFGTPWAFVQTQAHWNMLAPEHPDWADKLWCLATLEPIWGVYLPASQRYWTHVGDPGGPLLSLSFWNPVFFVLAGAFLALGRWKRWLTGSELVLGACLLAIPYLTRSYEMSMAAHGRFAAVVVVNYLVIGRLLSRATPLAVAAVCTALALWLCLFTALHAANYFVF